MTAPLRKNVFPHHVSHISLLQFFKNKRYKRPISRFSSYSLRNVMIDAEKTEHRSERHAWTRWVKEPYWSNLKGRKPAPVILCICVRELHRLLWGGKIAKRTKKSPLPPWVLLHIIHGNRWCCSYWQQPISWFGFLEPTVRRGLWIRIDYWSCENC